MKRFLALPLVALTAFAAACYDAAEITQTEAPGSPLFSLQAQTLTRVRIDTPAARTVADELIAAGHDVLEGSITDNSFEVVGSDEWIERLRTRGLNPVTIEVGRPFREIQEERQAGIAAVPNGYLNLAQINEQLQLAAIAYPGISQVVDLTAEYQAPATFEGRHVFALKISDNVQQEEIEPAFLLVSNHHAREIVTPVIALNTISELTAGYGIDPAITQLVNEYEIWIAPTWNPDGYNHVFEVQNLWRKNRRVFPDQGGVGVDQNRNYPFGWNSPCSGSRRVTSETYRGPSPASEAETQTMMLFSEDRNFAKVIDYHSSA